jgi:hypothetical protein
MPEELKHLSLATTYEVDDTFDSEKFIKLKLRVCHDGVNPNSSKFDVDDMEKSKDSMKNIPILANVIFDENDQPQFGSHDISTEPDKMHEGEYKVIYKETPIGVVPETNNHEIKQFNGKNYVFTDCFVWKNYSNYAEDIINRDKDIKLSMEIIVDNYVFDSKTQVYQIKDYRYTGITFLNNDLQTGMENAMATTGTFSLEESKEKMLVMMTELKDELNNIQTSTKYKDFTIDYYFIKKEIACSLVDNANEVLHKLGFDCKEWTVDGMEYDITGVVNKTLNKELSEQWGFDIYDKDTITLNTNELNQVDKTSISISSVKLLLNSTEGKSKNLL